MRLERTQPRAPDSACSALRLPQRRQPCGGHLRVKIVLDRRERSRGNWPPPGPDAGPASHTAAPANRARSPSPSRRGIKPDLLVEQPRRIGVKPLPVTQPARPPVRRRGVLAARKMRGQVACNTQSRSDSRCFNRYMLPLENSASASHGLLRKSRLHLAHNALLIGRVVAVSRQLHQQIEPPRAVLIVGIGQRLHPGRGQPLQLQVAGRRGHRKGYRGPRRSAPVCASMARYCSAASL